MFSVSKGPSETRRVGDSPGRGSTAHAEDAQQKINKKTRSNHDLVLGLKSRWCGTRFMKMPSTREENG
jgi:hypothetical protein